jgi:hypothetical protein
LAEGVQDGSGKSLSEGRQLSRWKGDLGVRFDELIDTSYPHAIALSSFARANASK